MSSPGGAVIVFLAFVHLSKCAQPLRGPPQFEQNPQYSTSYIPASMQIMAYLTDLMKYELKPSTGTTTTTTTRPTSAHSPGLFAPSAPPGPTAHFAKMSPYEMYVHRLVTGQLESSRDYSEYSIENADAVMKLLRTIEPDLKAANINDLELLGQGPNFLHKLVNGLDEEYDGENEEARVQMFSEQFDDTNFHSLLARQKKTPPTRAYVTLLSLYDMLNKEAKKLGLNKFNGYSQRIVKDLSETSGGTSSAQLKYVLGKMVQNQDTKDQTVLAKVKTLIDNLGKADSYINVALRYIPALQFEY